MLLLFRQAIRLTHMSKASLADDEQRDGGDSQDMTSKIYTIIRDYGEYHLTFQILVMFLTPIHGNPHRRGNDRVRREQHTRTRTHILVKQRPGLFKFKYCESSTM